MLLKNLDQQAKLVNGSRGIVIGFEAPPSADRLKRVKMYPEGSPPLVPRVAFQVRHPECERVPLLSAAECC